MRWRLLKLNWRYAFGELAIVVVGVLIALAVDQWNTDRIVRVEEISIVDRLIADLKTDLAAFEFELNALNDKEESLKRVRSAFLTDRQKSIVDPHAFLRDVIKGSTFGWNQIDAQRTTFNELLGAGKFGLIREPRLREVIGEYYDFDAGWHQRIDERETEYPDISYRLVPRVNEGRAEAENGSTLDVEPDLDAEDAQRLVGRIFESELADHVTAEINFARFVRNLAHRHRDRCADLLTQLEAYRDEIN
jgi:Family of unknown function (DUF6090)